ncbi:MAG: hypothetical protein LBC59_03985 [Chitinispirillales bacterium]|jgi:hypothetical protein|nr:hypothetical protein [Chitinispirillales bacterium]
MGTIYPTPQNLRRRPVFHPNPRRGLGRVPAAGRGVKYIIPQKREYQNLMNEYRDIGRDVEIPPTKGFDRERRQCVNINGGFKISSNIESVIHIENRVRDIAVGKDKVLILLADILANYIHNYMLKLPDSAPLHMQESYDNFDLRENIYWGHDKHWRLIDNEV